MTIVLNSLCEKGDGEGGIGKRYDCVQMVNAGSDLNTLYRTPFCLPIYFLFGIHL